MPDETDEPRSGFATQQTGEKYILRMPPGLRERIKAAASASGRSMNAEMVGVLLQAYPADPKTGAVGLERNDDRYPMVGGA